MKRILAAPIFAKLDENDLKRLASISIIRHYEAGEVLFYEGEMPSHLCFLLSGSIRLFKVTPKGKELFLHQLEPLNLIAEIANFKSIPYPATASFSSSSEVLKIDFRRFCDEFLTKPEISLAIISSFCEKLKIATNLLHQELILSGEAKVAKFILEHEELFNGLKHNKIASILNLAPETFSRILNKFKALDIISLDSSNQITSKDEARLSELLQN